jgi:hypothetical protein
MMARLDLAPQYDVRASERPADTFGAASFRRLHRERPSTAGSAPPSGMQALVALQQADGHWELTADLAVILGRELSEIETALSGASGTRLDVHRAWATALALAWLLRHARDVEGEWMLLGAKARDWLDDVGAVPPGGWTWIDAARQFLST